MIKLSLNKKTLSPDRHYEDEEGIIIILCTVPDESTAKIIINNLISKKLAACVTMLPNAISFYSWQGKLEQQIEIQILIKTDCSLQEEIFSQIKTDHPYQVPELLAIRLNSVDDKYFAWIKESVK